MIYAMTRHYESSARKSKNLQVEIALEAAELGGTEVGGQDLLGEELAVRDAEGPAGRAPRDEGVGGGCGYRGSWPLREKDACLCGTVRIDASGSGSNRQLLLLLLMSCRFHLEHLVEAAGKLLGNPSLPRFGEADGRGEIDGDFGLHACRLCCTFIMTTHSAGVGPPQKNQRWKSVLAMCVAFTPKKYQASSAAHRTPSRLTSLPLCQI
jgi:hypothetical protein